MADVDGSGHRFWLQTRRLTGALLGVWLAVNLLVPWFARDLNAWQCLRLSARLLAGRRGRVAGVPGDHRGLRGGDGPPGGGLPGRAQEAAGGTEAPDRSRRDVPARARRAPTALLPHAGAALRAVPAGLLGSDRRDGGGRAAGPAARLDRRRLPGRHRGACTPASAFAAAPPTRSSTSSPAAACRRCYNGMATAADWMSAASFIGTAGVLYLQGYAGLAYILGWTGGYCLLALLLAPYLRRFGEYTVPDFLGARYGGQLPRLIGAGAAIGVSFVYVVVQIYGVGPDHLAPHRLRLRARHLRRPGRRAGVLVPRRHARRDLDPGGAVPGADRRLPGAADLAVAQPDRQLAADAVPTARSSSACRSASASWPPTRREQEVHGADGAACRRRPSASCATCRRRWSRTSGAVAAHRRAARRERAAGAHPARRTRVRAAAAHRGAGAPPVPARTRQRAGARRSRWPACRRRRCRSPPAARRPATTRRQRASRRFDAARINFIALVLCLMMGTAAMPHVLTRYYTTPSVSQARRSVALVAALHHAALHGGAGAGGAGQVRGPAARGRHCRSTICRRGSAAGRGSIPAWCRCATSTATASCSSAN